jgi:hypothetical protein
VFSTRNQSVIVRRLGDSPAMSECVKGGGKVATQELVRPQGDDAPWSSDLDETEDGSQRLWVGVEHRQRRPLVFLVEADSGLRQTIGKGLRDQGYLVSEAGSVDELEMDLTFAYLNGSESHLDALIVPGAPVPGQDEHAIARLLQRQSWRLPLVHAGRLDRPLSLASVCDAIAAFVSARP